MYDSGFTHALVCALSKPSHTDGATGTFIVMTVGQRVLPSKHIEAVTQLCYLVSYIARQLKLK